jgi:DNA invertase Pin-like site-specific DNA recombinase
VDAPAQNGRLVGYARVSTDDQDLSLHLDALKTFGEVFERSFGTAFET